MVILPRQARDNRRENSNKETNFSQDFPDVWALSDEVYRTVRFVGGRHASLRQYLPEQTVSVSGMSKEVSGTGLRLGFCAGPLNLISLIRSIQSNSVRFSKNAFSLNISFLIETTIICQDRLGTNTHKETR
jgi:aspartate/methionine/tyrosine aminotransferase